MEKDTKESYQFLKEDYNYLMVILNEATRYSGTECTPIDRKCAVAAEKLLKVLPLGEFFNPDKRVHDFDTRFKRLDKDATCMKVGLYPGNVKYLFWFVYDAGFRTTSFRHPAYKLFDSGQAPDYFERDKNAAIANYENYLREREEEKIL